MIKLNNKAFAVTTILYSIIALITMTLALILGIMSGVKKNQDDLVDSIKDELNNNKRSMIIEGIKLPVKKAYGCTWVRVFHHNTSNGLQTNMFLNEEEVAKVNMPNKQSVLGYLDEIAITLPATKYEFLLEYPEISGYNWWYQSSNPWTTIIPDGDFNAVVPDYREIKVSWKDHYWGGLAKSTSNQTALNGSIGHPAYYYAIGSYQCWPNPCRMPEDSTTLTGIPGPDVSIPIKQSVDLWMRIA